MKPLYIHNSFSRSKEEFKPLDANHIRLYVCGPTVYDRIHLGNARPIVIFDTLFRLLKHIYPKVTYVRNITDVDDKIIIRAKERDIPISQLTCETTELFHQDIAALNTLPPTIEPKATEHIGEMIAQIQALIERNHAYEAEGHVLFHVPSMDDYGMLSKLDKDAIIAGARVEVASYKKDASDFILWKPAKDDEPGWDSPWGCGRPGWHIECSAMSEKYIGKQFDIHGGGLDLTFPHHENEIAQSCCANGFKATEGFAQYWMHNGMLMVEGEKMSKSLGNFFTVGEILEKHHGEIIRLLILSTHYRKPLDWTWKSLEQSKEVLGRFYTALRNTQNLKAEPTIDEAFLDALKDDLNTAEALSIMHEITTQLNKAKGDNIALHKGKLLGCGQILGILEQKPEDWFKWQAAGDSHDDGLSDADIEALIQKRNQAKANKDWIAADTIRDELLSQGIHLEDSPQGTIWKR
ncbi:MAG: cysteine--tRNA ligase [Alphaproteobacteria bacterium]